MEEEIRLTGGIINHVELNKMRLITSITIISAEGKKYTLRADSESLDVVNENDEFVYGTVI